MNEERGHHMIDPSRVITRSVLIAATGLGIALAGPVAAAPGNLL